MKAPANLDASKRLSNSHKSNAWPPSCCDTLGRKNSRDGRHRDRHRTERPSVTHAGPMVTEEMKRQTRLCKPGLRVIVGAKIQTRDRSATTHGVKRNHKKIRKPGPRAIVSLARNPENYRNHGNLQTMETVEILESVETLETITILETIETMETWKQTNTHAIETLEKAMDKAGRSQEGPC